MNLAKRSHEHHWKPAKTSNQFFTKILGALALVLIVQTSTAQNQFHLTQYMVHQPFINPAAMGSYNNLNAAVFYRNQWVGFDGAPTLQGFNINSPIGDRNHIGLTFTNDQIGVNQVMDVNGSYAYRLPLSDKANLTFGLSASLKMMQSKFSEVENVAGDPSFNANTPLLMLPNFKFGTYFNTEKFYVGLAIPNLLKNSVQFTSQYEGTTEFDFKDMHFYLHSGYSHELSDKVDWNSSILIKEVPGAPVQLDVNTQFLFNDVFGVGVSYRTSKEIAGLVQFKFLEKFTLAYAYDFNFGELNNYSSGSHEIMLLANFIKGKERPSIEAPRF